MRCLTRKAEITKFNYFRSENIKANLQQGFRIIENKQLNWYGYIIRINQKIILRKIKEAGMEKKRSKERRKTWMEQMKQTR